MALPPGFTLTKAISVSRCCLGRLRCYDSKRNLPCYLHATYILSLLTSAIDIVGNNIPVFFIQDAIKFPDLIHAVKPQPDREIPQAATAHDSAWDFFSQQPSTLHTLFWAMSGHGTVRSYRHMDGWGVHTVRSLRSKPLASKHLLIALAAPSFALLPPMARRSLSSSVSGLSREKHHSSGKRHKSSLGRMRIITVKTYGTVLRRAVIPNMWYAIVCSPADSFLAKYTVK